MSYQTTSTRALCLALMLITGKTALFAGGVTGHQGGHHAGHHGGHHNAGQHFNHHGGYHHGGNHHFRHHGHHFGHHRGHHGFGHHVPFTAPIVQPVVQPIVLTPPAQPNITQQVNVTSPPPTPQVVVPEPGAPLHVGNFQGEMGNGVVVQLALGNGNSFQWIATDRTGVTKEFTGYYSMSRDKLILKRADNGEKFAGEVIALTETGFRFEPFKRGQSVIEFARG